MLLRIMQKVHGNEQKRTKSLKEFQPTGRGVERIKVVLPDEVATPKLALQSIQRMLCSWRRARVAVGFGSREA